MILPIPCRLCMTMLLVEKNHSNRYEKIKQTVRSEGLAAGFTTYCCFLGCVYIVRPDGYQYERAKITRHAEGLPVTIHLPGSLSPGTYESNGMQRMVALVSSLIFSSVSVVPSQ